MVSSLPCKIQDSDSSVAIASSILGCDTVSIDEYFSVFQSIKVPSSSGSSRYTLKMKALSSFQTLGTTWPTTWHPFPEDLDFYFTGQEGNMHSVLSHSLYFIHNSRNTYVTANEENVIPLLIFGSTQNIHKKSGIITQSIALASHFPCATVNVL